MKTIHILLFFTLVFISCNKDEGDEILNDTEEAVENIFSVEVSNIQSKSANLTLNFQVNPNSQITNLGFVWSEGAVPTIDNDRVIELNINTSSESVLLDGLTSETDYYIRGFIQTQNEIIYSEEILFTTLSVCSNGTFTAPNGFLQLNSQTQVNKFGLNNYCNIKGFLIINSTDISDSIIDLSPLNSLKRVDGIDISNLNVTEIKNGLTNLQEVGDSGITLGDNKNLINLNFLSNVKGSVGSLTIYNNQSLNNLDGLLGITIISSRSFTGESISVTRCNSLETLNGLSNLIEIFDSVYFANNDKLKDLNAFKNITLLPGNIEIYDHLQLTELIGLENLNEVRGEFVIWGNQGLLNFNRLQSLRIVNEIFLIQNNESLENINGLSNLSSNKMHFRIVSNNKLNSIEALSNLTKARAIQLYDNLSLADYSGLRNLTEVELSLSIWSSAILSLEPLRNFRRAKSFYIRFSENITNLDALVNLELISEDMGFSRNTSLRDYCGLNNLTFGSGLPESFSTNSNGYNPTLEDMQNGNCSQ